MLISKENINSSEQSQGNDERYVMHLMDKIASQAEEIGRLKERNKQLERENMELRTISNSNLTPQDVERVFAEPNTVQKV